MKLKKVERLTQKELDLRLRAWRRGRQAKQEGKKYRMSYRNTNTDGIVEILSWTKGYNSVR
jgi:hypothetical protein